MFAEDLGVFFNSTTGVAVAATYDGATAVNVVPDFDFIAQDGMAGHGPSALGKASDFPAGLAAAGGCIGKTLLLSGVTYRIVQREKQDDGAVVRLQLQENA
jgi:hypothetical protein